jgi:hypothetical protein
MLICLWCIVGVSHMIQTLGIASGHGNTLLSEAKVQLANERFTRLSSKVPARLGITLDGGEPMSTHWPHVGVHVRGLSCGGDASGTWVAASSRFNIFAARLPAEIGTMAKLANDTAVVFEAAPACWEIEGDSLQDIALQCSTTDRAHTIAEKAASKSSLRGNSLLQSSASVTSASPAFVELTQSSNCSVLVLHKQGQRLTSCQLPGSSTQAAGSSLAGDIGANWLQEVGAAGEPQEEVSFITIGGSSCRGKGPCAFAQTTEHRIVELEVAPGKDNSDATASWFPARVVHASGAENSKRDSHGGLSVVGSNGKYLVELNSREQTLKALDLKVANTDISVNVTDTKHPHQWQLPEDHRWVAACSSAESIFMLAEGPSPQLWRFPLPFELQGSF